MSPYSLTAELDLRPVSSYLPKVFFRIFDIRVYGIIEKDLFRPENQVFHFISPNFIVIHIFFIVKFLSSFDEVRQGAQSDCGRSHSRCFGFEALQILVYWVHVDV